MADNINVYGNGTAPVSTEDIGAGLQMPRSKVVLGNANIDGGDVSTTNPLPITATPPTTGVAAQVSVGLTAVQLPANAILRSFMVKSNNGNTGTIYAGYSSSVTTSNGFEIGAGEVIKLELNNTNLIWLIANTAGQTISLLGI